MNQSYGRLVSRAAIAATAMASRRAGGFAGGYRRVVDEFTGGAIFPATCRR